MDEGAAFLMFWLLFVALFGWWGSTIMRNKGRSPGAGFALGAILGLIGIVIAFSLSPRGAVSSAVRGPAGGSGPVALRECPACRENMRRDASICPHCRTESEPWVFNAGYWWVQREGGWYYLDEKRGDWVRNEPAFPQPPVSE